MTCYNGREYKAFLQSIPEIDERERVAWLIRTSGKLTYSDTEKKMFARLLVKYPEMKKYLPKNAARDNELHTM